MGRRLGRILAAVLMCSVLLLPCGSLVSLEAKAEVAVKAKSLKVFTGRYKTPFVFRTSLLPYFKGDNVTDVPLFAVSKVLDMMRD